MFPQAVSDSEEMLQTAYPQTGYFSFQSTRKTSDFVKLVSQSALLRAEDASLLLFSPPRPMHLPARCRYQQHDEPCDQQNQRHYFSLGQSVEGERDAGSRHADHQWDDPEGKHAAVPGLLSAAGGLGQTLQRGQVLRGFGYSHRGRPITGKAAFRVQHGQLRWGWRLAGQAARWAAHLTDPLSVAADAFSGCCSSFCWLCQEWAFAWEGGIFLGVIYI